MAEKITSHEITRYAVVTGGNKGIGYETCKKLASKGVVVVLTARDEKRGIEAFEKLKEECSTFTNGDQLFFHQLDVTDPATISSLVDFITTKFGKLDILVNNAGIGGLMVEGDILILKELIEGDFLTISTENGAEEEEGATTKSIDRIVTNYEMTKQCLETNFYGAKRMIEAFIPLLHLSNSPTIVNVASFLGKLKLLCNEWAVKVLSDANSLTEERVDEVLNEFLKDFKEKSIESKGWPSYFAAYKVSKAAMIAYTRVLAKKYPNFRVNAVCPGYCKTDVNCNTGTLTAEDGAESLVNLAILPYDGPSGLFFYRKDATSF